MINNWMLLLLKTMKKTGSGWTMVAISLNDLLHDQTYLCLILIELTELMETH